METLVGELRMAIQAAFEGEEFRAHKDQVESEAKKAQEEAFGHLNEKAQARGLALARTPVGMMLTPVKDGRPMPPDEFRALPEDERKRLEEAMADLQRTWRRSCARCPSGSAAAHGRVPFLCARLTDQSGCSPDGRPLRRDFGDLPRLVMRHLDRGGVDVDRKAVAGVFFLVWSASEPGSTRFQAAGAALASRGAPRAGRRCRLQPGTRSTSFVDPIRELDGAPVVMEDHPTYNNLIGRSRYRPDVAR